MSDNSDKKLKIVKIALVGGAIFIGCGAMVSSSLFWIKNRGKEVCSAISRNPQVKELSDTKLKVALLLANPISIKKVKTELESEQVFKRFVKRDTAGIKGNLEPVLKGGGFQILDVAEVGPAPIEPEKLEREKLDLLAPWTISEKAVLESQEWKVTLNTKNPKDLEQRLNSLAHTYLASGDMPFYFKQITLEETPAPTRSKARNQVYKVDALVVTAAAKASRLPHRVAPEKPKFPEQEAWMAKFPQWVPPSLSESDCIKGTIGEIDKDYRKIKHSVYSVELLDLNIWYESLKRAVQSFGSSTLQVKK